MDIVDFAERFMNVKLTDWQKEHIRVLYEMSRDKDIRIVISRHIGESQARKMYIYMKENADGYKNERQPAYHSGYKSRVYVDEEHHRSSSWG